MQTANHANHAKVWRHSWDGQVLLAVLNHTIGLELAFMRGLDLSGSRQGAGGVGGLLAVVVGPAGPAAVANTTHFAAYDGNGNVTALVNCADGIDSARYEYGPFAEPLRVTGVMGKVNPIRFSTQYADDITGDLKYLFRDYRSDTGRWLSRDPIGEIGGPNLYGFGRNDMINSVDPHGLIIESVWDIASIVYDVGKITVGVVVNNPQLVADGTVDLATDTAALLIPGVPAGSSKVVRIFRSGKAAREHLDQGADVAIHVSKSRKVSQLNSTRAIAGQELQHYVTDIFKEDVVATNVRITVKTCTGKTIKAELDVVVKETAYELKNWGRISPGQAETIAAQFSRQTEVVKVFKGKHGGVIV